MNTRLSIFLLGLILCLLVYPSSFIYPKDTLPDSNDTRLISYIVGQVQNNILENKNIYQATFFAPEPNTLTYSDLFLTTSLLTLPARLFTSNPVLVFNIGFILNFTLTFFTSYLFFTKIGTGLFGPLLATLIFNLSGIHLHYYAHQQVFNFWMFFGALYNLVSFLKSQNQKHLHLFLTFVTLQLAETIFTTYLLFFASAVLYLSWQRQNNLSNNRALLKWIASFVPYVILWILLLLPYAKTHILYHEASRSIHDAAHFSLGLEEIFTKYQSWATLSMLAIGIVARIFSVNYSQEQKRGIFLSRKIFATRPKQLRTAGVSRLWFTETGAGDRAWIYIFIFSVIMSLGPVLKLFGQTIKPLRSLGVGWPIPLPYTLFYYLFPGFTGFRTPSRFILLALFAVCTLVAIYASSIFKALKTKTKILVIFLIFILLALENKLPLTGFPVNTNPPTVYDQVKVLPDEATILELPIKLWNTPDHQIESIRALYSLQHKHKRLNGYSGFATLEWIKLIEEINAYGLTDSVIQKLKLRGVTHIIQNNELLLLSISLPM